MSFLTTFLIALGLSADAFAVSISTGISLHRPRVSDALKVGLSFGGFQALMPVLGWRAGYALKQLITELDHWVAFVLLAFVGGKMLYESFRGTRHEVASRALTPSLLLVLAVATSIDALAVGISFSFLLVSIAFPVLVIGLTTFTLSLCGVFIGDRCGRHFERNVTIVGGLILIAIGAKIFIEHEFGGLSKLF